MGFTFKLLVQARLLSNLYKYCKFTVFRFVEATRLAERQTDMTLLNTWTMWQTGKFNLSSISKTYWFFCFNKRKKNYHWEKRVCQIHGPMRSSSSTEIFMLYVCFSKQSSLQKIRIFYSQRIGLYKRKATTIFP